MNSEELKKHLDQLYLLSLKAEKEDEIPVSAILITKRGIYTSYNHVEEEDNPFCHAEIEVLEEAMKEENTRYLKDSILLVSLEPCLMCMGAILKAGVSSLYYVLDDEKAGSLSYYHICPDNQIQVHQIQDERFMEPMTRFFRQMREKTKKN